KKMPHVWHTLQRYQANPDFFSKHGSVLQWLGRRGGAFYQHAMRQRGLPFCPNEDGSLEEFYQVSLQDEACAWFFLNVMIVLGWLALVQQETRTKRQFSELAAPFCSAARLCRDEADILTSARPPADDPDEMYIAKALEDAKVDNSESMVEMLAIVGAYFE